MKSFFKIGQGQATIELAMMLVLLFLITIFTVKQFGRIYDAKKNDIDNRNYAVKESLNGKKGVNKDGKVLFPDMDQFDLPGGRSFIPPWVDFLPIGWDFFGDDVMKKIGLGKTNSWWRSGVKGGVDAYVKSGFKTSEIPWGFAYGASASGDAKGFFLDEFGAVGGVGLQGTITSAIASKGDWDEAFKSGLGEAFKTDNVKSEMAKAFGNKDFLISTTSGAVTGGLAGGGILAGAAEGALASKLVQGNMSSLVGGKDYMMNASNKAITTALHGNTDAILTNAASAAFTTASVQKSIFGADPSAIIQKTGNAAFSGGMSAIQSGDISQFTYGTALGAGNALMLEAVKEIYPDPKAEDLKDEKKLKEHMKDEEFVAGLATMGTVIVADPNFAQNYATLLTTQLAVKAVEETAETVKEELKTETASGAETTVEIATTDGSTVTVTETTFIEGIPLNTPTNENGDYLIKQGDEVIIVPKDNLEQSEEEEGAEKDK